MSQTVSKLSGSLTERQFLGLVATVGLGVLALSVGLYQNRRPDNRNESFLDSLFSWFTPKGSRKNGKDSKKSSRKRKSVVTRKCNSPIQPPTYQKENSNQLSSSQSISSLYSYTTNPSRESLNDPNYREMCDCQVDRDNNFMDDEMGGFQRDMKVDIPPINVLPVCFTPHKNINLLEECTKHPDRGLCEQALTLPAELCLKTNVLTPFRPIIHATVFGHKHGYLIQELVDNYAYLETSSD